jgi:hypothetical protein
MLHQHRGVIPIDRDGLCLLSLDGGGVRGLSSLYILKCIMTLVNSERQGKSLKPCDLFDMIGGTSTGGYEVYHESYGETLLTRCFKGSLRLCSDVWI